MRLTGAPRWFLRIGVGATMLFIYIPLAIVVLYSFNESRLLEWPPPGLTLEWWGKAIDNQGARDALVNSLKAAIGATTIALLLGTLASLAVARFSDGRRSRSW
jgi:putative spermidine/putrescine transport system permease protein